VAAQLGLSTHQLSELVNHELAMGFSQLLRKYRVAEAKRMLQDEPEVSVLAIGLSVGFASQSNFYTAFKEIEGVTPGGFRKALKV
jgi:AraC-like DNA-binding protein